jgi:uncharacterized protein YndB with AHSA1/START domain
MVVKQLGNETTTVYAAGEEFVMERVFDAPRELVWKALTDPQAIPRWWGPRETTMTVAEMDVRPGGTWRWISHSSDGDAPFKGEYLEVVPPERLVHTEIFDVEPFNADGQAALVTILLEAVDGKTKLTSRSRFPSAEALEGALATGMVGGAIESWDRLEEEVARR